MVPQRPNLDFSLTAREILIFHAAYFGIASKERNERADELLEKFKLTDRANQMVRGFSGGMMQRLSIARAMMHDPQVLFLDEPSAGLDPQTRMLLWEIIREYNQRGKTVLLTTHNMEEADALCQRLAIIDHGQVIAHGHTERVEGSRSPADSCCACVSASRLRNCCSVCSRWPEFVKCEPRTRTGADVYADRGGSLIPEVAQPGCDCGRGVVAMCTSPSPAWKICSCTTPEGACAIELENFCRDAGARRSRRAAQRDSTLFCRPSCSRCCSSSFSAR